VTLLSSPRYFGNDTLVGEKKPASFDAGFLFGVPTGSYSILVLSHFKKINLKVAQHQTQLRKKLSMC
jgi:hypothetical protein